MQFVTLTDVRAHLNITGGAEHDNELSRMAEAAEQTVLDISGPVGGDVTVTLSPSRSGLVLLPDQPVAAVTAVTSGGQPVSFTARPDAGLVSVSTTSPVTVTYTRDSSRREQVRIAVLMVTDRLWETQRGRSPSPLQGGGEPTFTPGLQGILSEVRALLVDRPARQAL